MSSFGLTLKQKGQLTQTGQKRQTAQKGQKRQTGQSAESVKKIMRNGMFDTINRNYETMQPMSQKQTEQYIKTQREADQIAERIRKLIIGQNNEKPKLLLPISNSKFAARRAAAKAKANA